MFSPSPPSRFYYSFHVLKDVKRGTPKFGFYQIVWLLHILFLLFTSNRCEEGDLSYIHIFIYIAPCPNRKHPTPRHKLPVSVPLISRLLDTHTPHSPLYWSGAKSRGLCCAPLGLLLWLELTTSELYESGPCTLNCRTRYPLTQ